MIGTYILGIIIIVLIRIMSGKNITLGFLIFTAFWVAFWQYMLLLAGCSL